MTTDLDIQLTATGRAPLVGVVMGSDSDWPTMEPAVAALAEFDIACEVGVVSAHRMPVPLKHRDGVDSLHSIVQMPAGVPVATVSIAGARNAGLLAARILGAGEGARAEGLRASMRDFQQSLRDVASAKGAVLAHRVAEDY